MGFYAHTTTADFRSIIAKDKAKIEREIVQRMAYAGETAVNYCRELRTYQDRTGNLRSSIGYAIYKNGTYLTGRQIAKTAEGGLKGKTKIAEIAAQYSQYDYTIILVAGMHYAAAVEARGLDVLAGGNIRLRNILGKAFKSI